MRYVKIAIIFLLLPLFARSQEILSPPPAHLITKFPFIQYTGGVIIVKALLDTFQQPLNFILDTGSGGISLDSATCKELNVKTRETDTTITGIGGIKKVHFAFNKTLHFPGLDVEKLNFHINDYEVLSSGYGEKIDGIIGLSFFSRYIVKVNYDSMQLEIFSKGKISYPSGGTLLHPFFASIPVQYVNFKDKRKLGYNFYFDTGAGLALLLSDKFVEDSALLSSKRKPVLTGAEGMMGRLRMRLTVIKEVKLGPYRFRSVPTYLYKDDFNVTNYPFTGGLIGSEIFRRFNLIINYGQKEIHLLPNSHYSDPFDYSYSGLSIYYIEGKILVEDVIKSSPADKAGFLVGDEVIGIANNFSQNIQAYKTALQVPNQKVKVIIRRNNELQSLVLNIGSIL
ncbi:aspartyl protease family protein [Ferruginibacter sp. HRS2-29]|uniref:aspartyl protease family protein n=1 Tax=Ferruginibacter sp. HRS2-29 TaxID=2487334 RepID=UPI0020CF04DC|nr:aspartyl protease family protein [Ferruginibacter sp. HRS2-29]MCP9752879.1 signal protein PDZ [Ferruginibacter sp. HRS2-29]